MFTMLLTLEFLTCQRAQKSECEQEMLILEILGPSDLSAHLKNIIGVIQKGKKRS